MFSIPSVLVWLASNWRVVAIAMLLAVPSLYATLMKHQRDSARDTIKEMVLAGNLQEERTKAEIARQQEVTKGVVDEHAKRLDRVRTDNKRLSEQLQQYASRSIVPAIPDSASGDDDPVACFDRGALNRELAGVFQRYAAGLSGIALEGEGVSAAFAACQEWVLKEAAKSQAPLEASPQPR